MGTRTFPYRSADGQIHAAPWYSLADGAPVGQFVASWDYHTVLNLHRQLQIDVTGLLLDCGLPPSTQLAVNVRYWPSTSLIRRTATHLPLSAPGDDGKVSGTLEAQIHGHELASAVSIETSIIVQSLAGGHAEPFVARRPGSILWRDEVVIRLEGTAGLLPVAPVSFKEQGLPERAGWYVSLDSSDWSGAAMGNLLVLLNDDNAGIRSAVESPDDPASAALLDALTVDVVCDLVGRALQDEEFPSTAQSSAKPTETTTAALVHGLIRSFLAMPTESVDEAITRLRDEWQRDPSRVRAQAQNGLRFAGSRTS
jgi:hypothetical protein